MKKVFALVLTVILALGLVACGSNTKAADPAAKSEGVMTHAEYAAADLESEVVVEVYVQATQSWWNDTITVYAADPDGGYFIYNLACSEADSAKLTAGTKIKVTGFKSEWAGEVEIIDGTFEIEEGNWVAEPTDVTALFGTDDLQAHQNECVAINGATVASAAIYKWDGSGADGDDLYFDVTIGGNTYTFTVESYLCGAGTEVYEAVKTLEVGQTIDLTGFLYWYEGAQPHVTSVTVK